MITVWSGGSLLKADTPFCDLNKNFMSCTLWMLNSIVKSTFL